MTAKPGETVRDTAEYAPDGVMMYGHRIDVAETMLPNNG